MEGKFWQYLLWNVSFHYVSHLMQKPLGRNLRMLLGIEVQGTHQQSFQGFPLPDPWNIFWTTVRLSGTASIIPPVYKHCKGQQYPISIPEEWSRPWDSCWTGSSSTGHTKTTTFISLMAVWAFVDITSAVWAKHINYSCIHYLLKEEYFQYCCTSPSVLVGDS